MYISNMWIGHFNGLSHNDEYARAGTKISLCRHNSPSFLHKAPNLAKFMERGHERDIRKSRSPRGPNENFCARKYEKRLMKVSGKLNSNLSDWIWFCLFFNIMLPFYLDTFDTQLPYTQIFEKDIVHVQTRYPLIFSISRNFNWRSFTISWIFWIASAVFSFECLLGHTLRCFQWSVRPRLKSLTHICTLIR